MADPQYNAQQVELLRQTLMSLYGRYITTADTISILKSIDADPAGTANQWYNQIVTTATATASPTATATATRQATLTPTATNTSAPTRTMTPTPTATTQGTATPQPTRSSTPSSADYLTQVPRGTATPTTAAVATVNTSPTPAPTKTATAVPTATATPSATGTPWSGSYLGSVTPSATPSLPVSGTPTPGSTPTVVGSPTAAPTVTTAPSAIPPAWDPTATSASGYDIPVGTGSGWPLSTIPIAPPTYVNDTSAYQFTAGNAPGESANDGLLGSGSFGWPMSTIPVAPPTYVTDTSTYQFPANNVPTPSIWGSLSSNFEDDYKTGGGANGASIYGNGDLNLGTNWYSAAAAEDVLTNPYALTLGILTGNGMPGTPTQAGLYSGAVGAAGGLQMLDQIAGLSMTGNSGLTTDDRQLQDNILTNQSMGDYATDVLRSQQVRGGGINPYAVIQMYLDAGQNPDSVGSWAMFGSDAKSQIEYAQQVFVDLAGVNMNPMMRGVLQNLIAALGAQYIASSGPENNPNGFVEYLMSVPIIQQIMGGA